MHRSWPVRRLLASLLLFGLSPAATSCSTAADLSSDTASGTRTIRVAAIENFWGSLAVQLGGSHVHVTSVITNPNTDPHDYEPTAADARTLASARLVIVNGVGYDTWARDLVSANPVRGRLTLDVGTLVGLSNGDNPHRWYDRADVYRVIGAITADYQRLDPADAAYFAQREHTFETVTLAPYNRLITTIKRRYAGTPIGASESIVAPLAQTLGLRLVTPPSFLQAVSDGTEPTAGDKRTIDQQISRHEIMIYVLNSQNVIPDVQEQVTAARRAGIPVTTVTETLAPASDSFEQWQVDQLRRLEQALANATHH
jgi:zinc/manganese transport system substrate-binding protein